MQKIYIVEDDDNIREMILYALSSTEFEGIGFADGKTFRSALDQSVPALLLLDIMLPGEDGLAILESLKHSPKFSAIPVIMLTAKGSEYDRIKGLDLGADDYITKPFSILEVLSRIRAVLRRCNVKDENMLSLGNITLYPDKRSVFVPSENESDTLREISLTYKEFELLRYLMTNEGIVLSRDKLLEHIWGFDYGGESRTVDMHIKSLRQKLAHCGSYIKTVRNVGYKADSQS